MRILLLTHRIPYPPNKGDKIRSYNLLLHLAARHEVHLACPLDDASDLEHVEGLRRQVAGISYERTDGLAARLNWPLALAKGEPVSVRAFYSRALQSKVDYLLERTPFDCVFAFSSPMAEYCFRSLHWQGGIRQMRKLMDLIDVDSAKWVDYAKRSTGWRRWIYQREGRLLAAYEVRIAREFDRLFLVTEAERAALPPGLPAQKVSALPNGVDLDYFAPTPIPESVAPRVVFTGVMNYWPNVEGTIWFVKDVWPAVRAMHPGAQLDIVGSKPDRRVLALGHEPGVHVTGFVPDVRGYVAAAQVCVAPLRIARGVQNKVLEAMAMGRAVVCTPQALEGIPAMPDSEVLVGAEAADFATAVNRILGNSSEASRVGIAARAYVERNHRWGSTLAPLDALLS